jgi:protein-tyrosine phosphatase
MHPINFRDVGEALSLWLDPSPIPVERLFRGGRFDTLSRLEDLGHARTILNLRRGADPNHLGLSVIHVPAPDDLENYDTGGRRVSDWIRRALGVLAAPETQWPVYIHCTSGRDRTGVVIAAALVTLGVPNDAIVAEYLLSDGADAGLIARALEGLASFKLAEPQTSKLLRRNLGAAR